MKSISFVAAGLFASLLALPMSVQAAAAERPAKPHSHMEEKTGIPASIAAAATTADSGVADNTAPVARADKLAKHLHPRDGK